jgi:hypothetical protein
MDYSNSSKRINSIKEVYQNYDVFIFDMDGVLVTIQFICDKWEGDVTIHAGHDAVLYLLEQGKKVIFYTNNSTKSRDTYVQRLKQYGIETDSSMVDDHSICRFILHHTLLPNTLRTRKSNTLMSSEARALSMSLMLSESRSFGGRSMIRN